MDTNTSGEELTTKTRKPYTITKQRERWTEDEHDRFLEALRLYGRAWQRIEEHIGTKTAVQIRSHAQKFFTKLEKEAEAKGIPVCKALDIEIPPPRPKRKPNTPYPRKLGNNGASSSPVSSTKDAKLMSSASSSHINQQPFLDLEKIPPSSEKTSNGKDTQSTFTESESTLGKGSGNNGNRTVQDVPKKNKERDGNNNITIQNYLQNHHPSAMMFRPMGKETHRKSNLQDTTTSSTTTSSHQQQQDDYRNFLQMSSTFSNLIISTLLQNPAAHAAATYAASFCPYANTGDSSSTQNSSSPPSLAAIAAATVAAATAWWASHGLLPVCPPPPFTCVPLPTTVAVPTPTMDTNNQVPLKKQTASKSPASSSGDSEKTGVTKINNDSKTNGDKVVADSTMLDSNNGEKKKPVDRSSCGSNTPSGSDAETDALDKTEKDKEDVVAKDVDANQLSIVELSNRRSKIRDNNNPATDSWKEVSEEGRIAFQALFARERLPQSFSPPQVAAENPNGKPSENISTTMPSVQTTRQTGFKPYKRCSMEVKESQVGNTTNNQSDEKVCKRIRLEGEAST